MSVWAIELRVCASTCAACIASCDWSCPAWAAARPPCSAAFWPAARMAPAAWPGPLAERAMAMLARTESSTPWRMSAWAPVTSLPDMMSRIWSAE